MLFFLNDPPFVLGFRFKSMYIFEKRIEKTGVVIAINAKLTINTPVKTGANLRKMTKYQGVGGVKRGFCLKMEDFKSI